MPKMPKPSEDAKAAFSKLVPAEPAVTHVVTRDGLDHPVVVLAGDAPHLARFLAPEDAHRLDIAIGDACEKKSRIATACSGGQVRPFDQHIADPALRQVVDEAHARDASTDDKHVGAVGQRPWIVLGRRSPERSVHQPHEL